MSQQQLDATETLLAQRKTHHGDFSDHASITQSLKCVMLGGKNWTGLSCVHREALEMIVHKIGRVLSGDPNHKDHWDDIAGYARLVSQRLPK